MRTQFNIRLPQATVERLERIRAALGLSQSELVDRLINTEWGRMRQADLIAYPNPAITPLTTGMNRSQLDDLETAVRLARLNIAATQLRSRKMPVLTDLPKGGMTLNYLVVFAPGYYTSYSAEERAALPTNVLADLDGARHLYDFLQNLEPAEAYRRWCKLSPSPIVRTDWLTDCMLPDDIDYEMRRIAEQMADPELTADQQDIFYFREYYLRGMLETLEGAKLL